MTEKPTFPTNLDLSKIIEALLFVSPTAASPSTLATALEIPVREVEMVLDELSSFYSQRGLRLQRHQGRVQLTTAPEIAPFIELFLGLEATSRLSKAALETLAIIAYQQPVTRPEIDSIRGVNSDSVLRNLISKGLVEEGGRADRVGRPFLYSTTSDFLSHFGLASTSELPPLIEPTLAQEDTNDLNQSDRLKG